MVLFFKVIEEPLAEFFFRRIAEQLPVNGFSFGLQFPAVIKTEQAVYALQ